MGMITLLRHRQTDFNATGLLQGHIDNSLNRTGFAQAKKAAEDKEEVVAVDAVVEDIAP